MHEPQNVEVRFCGVLLYTCRMCAAGKDGPAIGLTPEFNLPP